MKRCPITYQHIANDANYSDSGLKLLSPRLTELNPLAYTPEQLRLEAYQRADKMSIQGVQPKLSATLSIKNHCFNIVDSAGRYILKPEHHLFPGIPENEDLTMRLAKLVDIETPLHGLLYGIDGRYTYFIKRFDRAAQKNKLSVEDFSQLSAHTRATKYNSTMEKIIDLVERFTTFPVIEKTKLFRRILFNFMIGNEDMHLKNFSLITRDEIIELSPAYDLLNTCIIINNKEEIALPLHGKKNNLRKKDFIDYYAAQRLQLNQTIISEELARIENKVNAWQELISISFLNQAMQDKYLVLLGDRVKRIFS